MQQEFEDIMASIGEDIETGIRPLDAGLSNIVRVNVSNTEDYIPGKGKIFFDIHFTAYHKKMNFITVTMIICKKSEVSPAAIQKTNLWKRKAVCMQMYKIT